jgi:hypothetical protein
MATTLLPFRDYSEHDVINLFAVNGELTKGHIVAISAGWKNTDEMDNDGSVGASFGNTVSDRYGVAATVQAATNDGLRPIGMTLYDVKETDENGEKLIFNPRKAAEMEVALSGQAVPIVSRGVFLYDGSVLGAEAPVGGTLLYHDDNGELTTGAGNSVVVGKALGGPDADSNVLVHINL